jgi:hypothetical protein
MIRNIRGMISAAREVSVRVQVGRVHKFARSDVSSEVLWAGTLADGAGSLLAVTPLALRLGWR